MTDWNEKAKAIIYAMVCRSKRQYGIGRNLSGKISPSGKLPITIERDFKDSPGYGYVPEGESLYKKWNDKNEKDHPVYDIHYNEGIFSGYRWYEKKKIEPLYPFGYGLSYTNVRICRYEGFRGIQCIRRYSSGKFYDKKYQKTQWNGNCQLYIQDVGCSVPRPIKELKGFERVDIEAGQSVRCN